MDAQISTPLQVDHEEQLLQQLQQKLGPHADGTLLLHHLRMNRGKIHWAGGACSCWSMCPHTWLFGIVVSHTHMPGEILYTPQPTHPSHRRSFVCWFLQSTAT
jgi:hypothetical protein